MSGSSQPADAARALTRLFGEHFGRAPRAAARAPGRLNLIGEHTDYNQGLVLPCALDLDTRVALAPSEDGGVRCFSANTGESLEWPERGGTAPVATPGSTACYVAGVVSALAERGVAVPGFDLAIESEVPIGAGLSSSAALQVALATALDALLGLGLSAQERAAIAHRSENAFVGVRCGILDPFASALCEPGAALRIDCRDETWRSVPLPKDAFALLITDSGVARSLAAGSYNRRVAECGEALAAAQRAGIAPPAATSLRALGEGDLPRLEAALADTPFRRVRHVITENARVDAFAAALTGGDLVEAGALLCASQRSLRDDYEVSVPELDALCALGDAHPAVYGGRLTGAGFGGCTLHLVRADATNGSSAETAEIAESIADGFEARFGRRPRSWVAHTGRGASAIDLR